MADDNPSSKPQLSVRLRVDWLTGILRADRLRFDTLVSLVATWGEDEARDDTVAKLDALAEAVRSPREGELDSLIEDIETAAAMDTPEIEISLADARRLRDELDALLMAKARSRGASDIKHPTFARTRKHLTTQPIPGQRETGAA